MKNDDMKNISSIEDVREAIDEIDKDIINLLGKRLKYVEKASEYKKTEESVKAPDRVKKMLIQRKKWAYEKKLSMIFIEDLFKMITNYFIEKEKNKWIIKNKFEIDNLKIEKVSENELGDILNLQKSAFQSEAIKYNDFEIKPLTMTIEDVEKEYEKKVFFKAVFEDKIIGSVRGYIEDYVCYIEKLVVHPDFQNLGIAKKMIAEIENYFNTCKKYEIFTRKDSDKNIELYKKLGYQVYKEGRHLDLYDMIYLYKLR